MNKHSDTKKEASKTITRQYVKGLIYCILGAIILVVGFSFISSYCSPVYSTKYFPSLELPSITLPPIEKPKLLEPEKIIEEGIKPAIEEFKRKNLSVLKNCNHSLDEHLQQLYSGIDPFLDDLTSIRTKCRIAYEHLIGDPESILRQKFEHYIVSEEKLYEVVSFVIQQYMEGIGANINEMYSRINVNVKPTLAELQISENAIATFVQDSLRNSLENIQQNTHKVLMYTIVTYASSELASYLATKGTGIILSTAAVGVGSATSATTGFSIGSLVPGVGTIIGLGVGIVVGAVIENLMDNHFKEVMRPKIIASLDNIRNQVQYSFEKQLSDAERQFRENLNKHLTEQAYKFCKEQNNIIMQNFYERLANKS